MQHKHSRKRDAIVSMICSSKEHPSADDVYTSLKTEYPSISLGTVYRNISVLRNEGVIKSVGVVDGVERFDGNLDDHPHFVCDACGAVIDIAPEDILAGTQSDNLEKYGFEVKRRHIVYYGKCSVCARNVAHTPAN